MVGIFLGSFDPPHIGHLSIVSDALDYEAVNKVIVVPAFSNPWKENQTPWEIRYKMCLEAFSGYKEKVEISDAEQIIVSNKEIQNRFYAEDDVNTIKDKTVPSYVLLRYFRDIIKDKIFLITSEETFPEIKKWNHGLDVLKENSILLIQYDKSSTILPTPWSNTHSIFPKREKIKISSTEIRMRIKVGRIVHEYLPRRTEDLINELKLYK